MKHGERLAPQRGNMPVGAQTRIAMSMGAEMAKAEAELDRPPGGVEMAELAGAAARAAVFAYTDPTDPDTVMMADWPNISQLAFDKEWARLAGTDREKWR